MLNLFNRRLLMGFTLLNLLAQYGIVANTILLIAGIPMLWQLIGTWRKSSAQPFWWIIPYAIIVILLQVQSFSTPPANSVHWTAQILCGVLGIILFNPVTRGLAVAALLLCGVLETLTITYPGFEALSPLMLTGLFGVMILLSCIHYPSGAARYTQFYLQNTLRLAALISLGLGLLVTFFPRIPAALLPRGDSQIGFGSGNRLKPGDFAEMAQSRRVVLRAHFTGEHPDMEMLYWRGTTLGLTDNGLTWYGWTPGPGTVLTKGKNPAYIQTIQLEPRTQGILFAMDTPVSLSIQGQQTASVQANPDQTFAFPAPTRQPLHYKAESTEALSQTDLSPKEKKAYLQLPTFSDRRFKTFIHKIGTPRTTNADVLASRVLNYFHQEDFQYDLQPGPDASTDLAGFLFHRQRGSCAHFAAAFATIMRAEGIPARIVLGFQGGERNPVDGTILVRDLDAHAWVEIWVAHAHVWRRYDPTGYVAPLRVKLGAKKLVEIQNHTPAWLGIFNVGNVLRDAVMTQITAVLLNTNLPWLTDLRLRFWLLTLVYLGLASGIALILRPLLSRSSIRKPEKQLFEEYTRLLSQSGVSYSPSQGPRDYLVLCLQAHPHLKPILTEFTELYIAAHYGPSAGHSQNTYRIMFQHLKQLKQQIHQSSAG